MVNPKRNYSPSDVFQAVLFEKKERGQDTFPYDLIGMHKAFFEAEKKYPEIMSKYDFTKVINPHSAKLDHIMAMHIECGLIAIDPDVHVGNLYILDLSKLKKPSKELEQVAEEICNSLALVSKT